MPQRTVALPKPSRTLWLLGQPLIRWWLTHRFRVHVTWDPALASMRGPWLLLANHVAVWDFLLTASLLPRRCYFVSADGNFRSRVMRFLMYIGGALPKSKARSDVDLIRAMQELVQRGEIIALFPEGQRTWDGRSRHLLPGVGKLARLLDAPIAVATLKGGYSSRPRWSRRRRRGRMEVEFTLALPRSAVRQTPRAELDTAVARALYHDEDRWIAADGARFATHDRAEYAETALFYCPACGAWDRIESAGTHIRCRSCGYEVVLRTDGRLQQISETRSSLPFQPSTIADWNAAQLALLRERVTDETDAPLPLSVPHVQVLQGHRRRPLRAVGEGAAMLDRRGIHLPVAGSRRTLSPETWSGINVQFTHQLEFYAHGTLWIVRTRDAAPSAYRLEQTMLALLSNRRQTQ